MSPSHRASAAALSTALSLAALMGCAQRVVIETEGPFVGAGAYKSRSISAQGGHGYHLELKRNGHFVLRAYAAGCPVREESGTWSAGDETLDLVSRERRTRESCPQPWRSEAREVALSCPVRKLSDRAFSMIHEEIGEGTAWTEWTRVGLSHPGEPSGTEPRQDSILSASISDRIPR